MSLVRPRYLAHKGSVLASGLAIDMRLVPEAEARGRILRELPPGGAVFRSGDVLIASFRTPRRMSCDAALGMPLVRYDRLLSACPLTKNEWDTFAAAGEAVVLVSGGVAHAIALDDSIRQDVSLWLDLSEFAVEAGLTALGSAVPEPRGQLTPLVTDIRKSLGVAPLDEKAQKLAKILKEGNRVREAKGLVGRARAFLARMSAAPANLILRAMRRPKATPQGGRQASLPSRSSVGPVRESILARLQRHLARALWSSKLGNLLGRQYGRYLARLLDMFDGNDLDNALKHALALNPDLIAGGGRLPLWSPSPRENLAIKPARVAGGAALGLGDDLYEMLRERYRRAFQRLEAAGDIKKAAFVLAELLNANEEAVAFLEKHRHFALAAEIAEARALAPGLIVRLWFLAGERERAIRIARGSGAFADAVFRLSASHGKEADMLRLLWAHHLAESGQYAAAVDAAWPIEAARNLAYAWMEKAIEIGGAAGARMLARKLVAPPENCTNRLSRVLEFLEDEEPGSENLVRIFAETLAAHSPLPHEGRLAARAAARRLISHLRDKQGVRFLQNLIKASGDAILRADWRGGSLQGQAPESPPSLASRSEPLHLIRKKGDVGAIALWDSAQLPDGRILVACGELGALLLSRDGRTLARFSEPASSIVMSDNGDRAILAAQRGEIYRLARLDLLAMRLRPWCDARFDLFAPDFDGSTWFVARGGTLYAIDALANRWEHLWKVDEPQANITSVRRDAKAVTAFFKWEGRYPEIWTYDYPSLILRRRRQVNQGEGRFTAECVSPSGDFGGWRLYNNILAGYLNSEGAWTTLPLTASGNEKAHWLTGDFLAMSSSDRDNTSLYLLDRASCKVRARIAFEGSEIGLSVRFQAARASICDDRGRVLVLDLGTGEIMRELRVGAS